LVTAADAALDEAQAVASALAGAPVDLCRLPAGGRNSRIYRVRAGERLLALKQYPSRQDDPRDRLSTEVGALQLMERCGIDNVPRIVGVDRGCGYALMTWIDGSQVGEVSDADLDAAVAFLTSVHELRHLPEAAAQPMAAEACLAGVEIARQIDARLALLQTLRHEQELIDFIDASLVPERKHRVVDARCAAAAAGLDFEADLPQEWQTLVPADFGFHNSLRRGDGSLAFVDFEYFGWDDPVKLTADILLHPGWPLSASLHRRFRGAAARIYGDDPLFESRLAAYLPLFALRWVLILLNEFLPERWQRRVLAGETAGWENVKARQLARARAFLGTLSQTVEA
jgi:hypothetical protein